MTRASTRNVATLLALGLVGTHGAVAGIQTPPAAAVSPVVATSPDRLGLGGFRQVASSRHARGTIVAISVLIPTGSAHDPPGMEGTAWLLGRVTTDQATARLDPAQGTLTSSVGRSHTRYTLLAMPDAWEAAWRAVSDVIFDTPARTGLFESRRGELLDRIAFEAGSPARAFQQEATAMLGEPGSPWARPVRGTPESLAALGPDALNAFRQAHYRRSESVVAVVGPVPDFPADSSATVPPAQGQAWLVGDRVSLVQEVTNTWISAAYPAPAGMSRTALELVAHLLKEDLDPVPPDPDRFGVDVRLEEAPGGPVLVVEASVLPEAAARWEARITQAVRDLAAERLDEDFFRWKRRRFRAARLLDESRPEAEAERITGDLMRTGVPRIIGVEIWALDPLVLQSAAQALGEPRILHFGPDLGNDQGSRP